ncbi:MAG: glycosyltransferase family 2 protein [Pseudomonadota bacterium]
MSARVEKVILTLQINRKSIILAHPIVSVIMANYNGAQFIEAALRSVMAQSISQIEIVLADDASIDASVAIAHRVAAKDKRLKIVVAGTNKGPAVARNRALELATGEWIAIVDSDDIVHPQRFERMLEAAQNLQTDAIADDLTYLVDNTVRPGRTLLGTSRPTTPQQLTAKSFVLAAQDAPQLGYLKPMFRRAGLKGLRYREDIRIGEDHDFYMRFLLDGGTLHLLPESYYLYRRHACSISHRLHPDDVRAIIAVQDDLLTQYADLPADFRADLTARRAALQEPLAFETLVQNLKNRRFGHALMDVFRKPKLLWKLGHVARKHLARRLKPPRKPPLSLPRDPDTWTPQDWAVLSASRTS